VSSTDISIKFSEYVLIKNWENDYLIMGRDRHPPPVKYERSTPTRCRAGGHHAISNNRTARLKKKVKVKEEDETRIAMEDAQHNFKLKRELKASNLRRAFGLLNDTDFGNDVECFKEFLLEFRVNTKMRDNRVMTNLILILDYEDGSSLSEWDKESWCLFII
jgi:hypothetical protein